LFLVQRYAASKKSTGIHTFLSSLLTPQPTPTNYGKNITSLAEERSDESELVFKDWAKQCGIFGSSRVFSHWL